MRTERAESAPRILRSDDPRVPPLLAEGWVVLHRSWGARLVAPDPDALEAVVARAAGYRVEEVGDDADPAIAAIEAAVRQDYPGGPATAPEVHDVTALARLRAGGTRCFAAFDRRNELVGVTAIARVGDRGETDFTSVARAHRRRGVAEAVKAASVLALLRDGVAVFGTGGAEENEPSLAMNARLGYLVTERWLTLAPPGELRPAPCGCAAGTRAPRSGWSARRG